MKLLAVDTATEACSAALLVDGEITQQYEVAPQMHSHMILEMIDELMAKVYLKPAQLDCLAFGRGPGSFMGIRIAAGVVQGIGFAHQLPVVPVSVLQAMALNAHRETGASHILSAIDARMKEVYWAGFEIRNGTPELVLEESVCKPEEVAVPEQGEWVGAGTGWDSYGDVLRAKCEGLVSQVAPQCFPSAQAIAELAAPEFEAGNTVDAAAAVPVYIRDNVAAKPKAE